MQSLVKLSWEAFPGYVRCPQPVAEGEPRGGNCVDRSKFIGARALQDGLPGHGVRRIIDFKGDPLADAHHECLLLIDGQWWRVATNTIPDFARIIPTTSVGVDPAGVLWAPTPDGLAQPVTVATPAERIKELIIPEPMMHRFEKCQTAVSYLLKCNESD